MLGIFDYLHGTDTRFRASEQFQRHVMIFPGQTAQVPERIAVAEEVAAAKVAASAGDGASADFAMPSGGVCTTHAEL